MPFLKTTSLTEVKKEYIFDLLKVVMKVKAIIADENQREKDW